MHGISVRGGRQGNLKFRSLRADPEAFDLVRRVARTRRTSLSALLNPTRGRDREADARQLAMYLLHVVLGRSQETVAEYFRRDRTTVAHACQRLEDQRDDTVLEAEIAVIETDSPRIRTRAMPMPMEFKHAA